MGTLVGNINAVGKNRDDGISEFFTIANAVSDPAGNESNATTGFVAIGLGGGNTFASQSTVKNNGSYAIEANANPVPTNVARFYFDFDQLPLVEGTEYTLTLQARHVGLGGNWNIGTSTKTNTFLGGIAETLDNSEITFQESSFDFTYSTTGVRYFVGRELSGTDDGGVYIDNVSIKKK